MFREYCRRTGTLILGLVVSSVGIVMMLQANVGLEPWSVLQEGLSHTLGITYGTASALVGAAAIGAAVACKESFGLGTILNIVLCAILIDCLLALHWIPLMTSLLSGILMLLCGLELLVIGTWLYMQAALGSGPRDALMVGLARKTGRSVGLCRAAVELLVILLGWLLGGRVGIGTVISALGLGSLFNLNFALFRFKASELHQESVAETVQRLRRASARR